MEILGPNFLPIVLNIAILLTALSVLLLIGVTLLHWLTDVREEERESFDSAIKPMILSYLNGEMAGDQLIRTMRQDPSEAIHLLMHQSIELAPTERHRLQPLFAALINVEEEITALHSGNVKRRILAAECLGYIKSEAASEALLEVLDDEVPAIRLSAARSLAAHGVTEAIEPILQALDLPSELNELREVEAIFDFGPSAVPELISVLSNSGGKYSDNAVIVAARVLGLLKAGGAVSPLIDLLKSPSVSVRINSAHALGEIGDSDAVTALVALADDPAWEVRNKAMKSIGELQAVGEIPVLSNALSDTSWWVRFSAAQALHSLGQAGIAKLQEVMGASDESEDAHEICRDVLEEHNILDTKKV